MILKGNQRGGGRQMALHLLNGRDNDHVTVHEVRGFIAQDVLGALNEAYALSKGTQAKQYMYSLSLNPPKNESVTIASFEAAIEQAEQRLGLENQPRLVVFHEKEGRRHAHCVWSRIQIDEMKAINMSHDWRKLNSLSKSLYLEHGWRLPEGFLDKSRKNPLNFTRAEWEQAKKIGSKPSAIKQDLLESWSISDGRKTFEHALEERGYFLARGDRGGFVVIDVHGQIYPLNKRKIGRSKSEIAARLGKPETLSSIQEVQASIKAKISTLFQSFSNDMTTYHKQQTKALMDEKATLTREHKDQRARLKTHQDKRWQAEELERNKAIRQGFKGLWDKINGRYWRVRKANEIQTQKCQRRDRAEFEHLLLQQFAKRQELQSRIDELCIGQENERRMFIKDISYVSQHEPQALEIPDEKENAPQQDHQNDLELDELDLDIEPEL